MPWFRVIGFSKPQSRSAAVTPSYMFRLHGVRCVNLDSAFDSAFFRALHCTRAGPSTRTSSVMRRHTPSLSLQMRPAAYRSLTRCAPRSRFSMQAQSDHTPVVLGIETSCDDTAIAVVNGKRQVLYEASASQWFVPSDRRSLTCTPGPSTGASTREFILHLRCANTRMVPQAG